MPRHIPTLNYLWSAATCLTRTRTVIYWLSALAITDSANKCHVFDGHFNKKSVARIQLATATVRSNVRAVVWWPTSNTPRHRVMNHVIAANQPLHWLRLFYDITSEESCILFVQPAMSKNRTILSLYQRLEVLCRLGEAHRVERLLLSQCGKTQNGTYTISKQIGKATWPTFGWIQVFAQLLCCINFRFTNHIIHNYDNACIH